jgi:maltose alpha-D-glucosyltransferase/alpha-amylase
VDAAGDPDFVTWLVGLVSGRRRITGRGGELVGRPTTASSSIIGSIATPPAIEPLRGEQSNTSIRWGETGIIKLYRVVDAGENPEIEMGRVLTQRGFAHAPATAGWVEYRRGRSTASVAIVQAFVSNRGDVFDVAQSAIDGYLETAIGEGVRPPQVNASIARILERARQAAGDDELTALVGSFIGTAELLGRRTGELHRSLAEPSDDPAFAPERMTPFHQRSLYQSVRGTSGDSFRMLRARMDTLPGPVQEHAEAVLKQAGLVDARLRRLLDMRAGGMLIRCHGDYHAEQVLVTADDLMITDFEGQPIQPISQRRLKRHALVDVAGMIRSIHYAANGALVVRGEPDRSDLDRWAEAWYVESAAAFLRGYLEITEGTGLLPADDVSIAILLDVLLLQKATYELRYELGARPNWVTIPLRGLEAILGESTGEDA